MDALPVKNYLLWGTEPYAELCYNLVNVSGVGNGKHRLKALFWNLICNIWILNQTKINENKVIFVYMYIYDI